MRVYKAQKKMTGYSTCFRQWNALHSHCRYLHGYDLAFILHFQANCLDAHHWVWDFGWLKHPEHLIDGRQVKVWFDYMFDHTVIIAEDDPEKATFEMLAEKDLIQLRHMKRYSTEKVAELIYEKIVPIIENHSLKRVQLTQVDVLENDYNQASYIRDLSLHSR